jgi:serine/threonine protein kinase
MRLRVAEDMLFADLLPGDDGLPIILPDHLIKRVTIHCTHDNDLAVLFETKQSKFGYLVDLEDMESLSVKESQCLRHVIGLVERGASMTPDEFSHSKDLLKDMFHHVQLCRKGGSHVCAIRPRPPPTSSLPSGDSVQGTKFMFHDGNFILDFRTSSLQFQFTAILLTPHESRGLSMMECRLIKDLFNMSEPGDPMDLDRFFLWCKKFTKEYNIVQIEERGTFYEVKILPTSLEDPHTISPPLKAWMDRRFAESAGLGDGAGGCPRYKGFTLGTEITESGQAILYKGKRNSDGKQVAMKVYKTDEDWDEYQTVAKSLLKIGGHPNVVTLFDFFEIPKPCIVMEFINGKNLNGHLEANGPMEAFEAIKVGLGIAEGLAYLHSAGFVHCNLKSLNVLIDVTGKPILIDVGFGADVGKAAACDTTSSVMAKRGNLMGSILWMSPEMMANGEYSVKHDVYAFGIVFWEILSGKLPFYDFRGTVDNLMFNVQKQDHPLRPNLSALPYGTDKHLIKLITVCWKADPKKRPKMDEVVRRLRSAGGHSSGDIHSRDPYCTPAYGAPIPASAPSSYDGAARSSRPSSSSSPQLDRISQIFRRLDRMNTGALNRPDFIQLMSEFDSTIRREDAIRLFQIEQFLRLHP